MVDYRWFGALAHKLPPLPDDHDWTVRWHERNAVVRKTLGETVPPGIVRSYSWKNYIIPGACGMTFHASHAGKPEWLHMTLGLTHPLRPTDKAYPWEFCIRTKTNEEWATDLLYQLLCQWLWEKGAMGFGSHLPLKFFIVDDGSLWSSISDTVPIQFGQHSGVIRTFFWRRRNGVRNGSE